MVTRQEGASSVGEDRTAEDRTAEDRTAEAPKPTSAPAATFASEFQPRSQLDNRINAHLSRS